MNAQVCYERLKNHLLQLKLETALNHLDPVLEGAMRAEQSTVEVLEKLLHIEVQERFERRLRTNFRLSGLPVKKRLEDFDFEAQPQVPKAMLQELANLLQPNDFEVVGHKAQDHQHGIGPQQAGQAAKIARHDIAVNGLLQNHRAQHFGPRRKQQQAQGQGEAAGMGPQPGQHALHQRVVAGVCGVCF